MQRELRAAAALLADRHCGAQPEGHQQTDADQVDVIGVGNVVADQHHLHDRAADPQLRPVTPWGELVERAVPAALLAGRVRVLGDQVAVPGLLDLAAGTAVDGLRGVANACVAAMCRRGYSPSVQLIVRLIA